MSEKIKILDSNISKESYVGKIIFSALVKSMEGRLNMRERFDIANDNTVSVELIVNGHSVPVVETFERYFNIHDVNVNARALEIAKEMVADLGFQRIADAVYEAERTIRVEMHRWMKSKGLEYNEEY